VKVQLECQQGTRRLPPDVETAIFRVVQECLSNVHRHAASPTASVRLHEKDGRILLEIRDEGRGILPEKQRELAMGGGGVGLRGMRERVAQHGRELSIQSSGSGTTVTATMPCA